MLEWWALFLEVLGHLGGHHDHLDLAASHTGGRSVPW